MAAQERTPEKLDESKEKSDPNLLELADLQARMDMIDDCARILNERFRQLADRHRPRT